MFNPEAFLEETTAEALDSFMPPLEEDDYSCLVEDEIVIKMVDIKTGDRAGQSVPVAQFKFRIMDEDKLAAQDREVGTVRHNVWLDVDETGKLDFSKGKNLGLGQLREATGQNAPGTEWSINMLKGAGPIMVRIGQRADNKNPERVYNEVRRLTAIT